MLASLIIILICTGLFVYWFVQTARLIRKLRGGDPHGKQPPKSGIGLGTFLILIMTNVWPSGSFRSSVSPFPVAA